MTTTTICRDRHTTFALAIVLDFSNIANVVKIVNVANNVNIANTYRCEKLYAPETPLA